MGNRKSVLDDLSKRPLFPPGHQIDLGEITRAYEAKRTRFSFTVMVNSYDAVVNGEGQAPRTEIWTRGGEDPWLVVNFNLDEAACKALVITYQKGVFDGEAIGRQKAQKAFRQAIGAPGYEDVEPRHIRFGNGD